jgi:23S rRNA (uracil1939-C5)-methyltransferase
VRNHKETAESCEAVGMEFVELSPHAMAAGGDALAREVSGRVVFVRGALPGETVSVRLVDEKKDFARGEIVEVTSPSPHRIAVGCPHARAGCGGCGWLHIDVAGQQAFKMAVVLDALRRTAHITDIVPTWGPTLSPTGYRTSARAVAGADGRLGFRAGRSHDVVEIDHCMVAHPKLDGLLQLVQAPPGREVSLRIGVYGGERTALLEGKERGALTVAEHVAVGADATVREEVGGFVFRISADSFFQTRPDGAAALVDEVGRLMGSTAGATLVDAYAGVGLFGATVGGAAERVIAIESNPSSVEDAKVNLRRRSVVKARVEQWKPLPADLVVADPARTGLGKEGASRLAATNARRVVLVSCDPVAFARDAGLLTSLGYQMTDVTLVDLFPHTPHIEVVSRFDRV